MDRNSHLHGNLHQLNLPNPQRPMNQEELAYYQMEGRYEELNGREPSTSDTYDDEEAYDS